MKPEPQKRRLVITTSLIVQAIVLATITAIWDRFFDFIWVKCGCQKIFNNLWEKIFGKPPTPPENKL